MFLVQNEDITIGEGLLFSLIAVLMVFIILLIVILCVYLISKIKFKESKKPTTANNDALVSHKLTIEDIKDEDMMVAALVATADYVEETKNKDARLVSIKQIG